MKIGFVGCGAIGSCYASYLTKNHEVCVLDTDRRVSGYTWGNLSDTVPNLLPFTDRTTSAGISGTWISPLLLG